MILDRLDAAAADPDQTYAAAAAVKILTNAAAALGRLHTLKRSALGIAAADMNTDEAPVLVIRNLTDIEVAAIRQRQDDEDTFDGDVSEDDRDAADASDDEIVCESEGAY